VLTILQIADPFTPVGASRTGGAAQVMTLLDEAVTDCGWRSLVIAPAGSSCRGTLIATAPLTGSLDDAARARAQREQRAAVERVLTHFPVDVVHLHGVDFHAYLPPPGPPALVTLHRPLACYHERALRPGRPRTFLHCVAPSQRRDVPAGVALIADIPNGVRVASFTLARRKGGFALALGRVCADKGFDRAIDACRRAHMPLVLAGELFAQPDDERWFHDQLAPLIAGGDGVRLLGPLNAARKRRLLAAARCLVVAGRVPATSALAAREALASGTPVVGLRGGALEAFVEPGRTGFLVDTIEELADAIARAPTLDPEACRRAAEEQCSAAPMVRSYLSVYRRLADGTAPERRVVGSAG